MLVEYPK